MYILLNYRTALHWAAKRNHSDVAHLLLLHGADKNMESFSNEIPADLSTSPSVLHLLGSPKMEMNKQPECTTPTITPHYLSMPNMGHQPVNQDQLARLSSSLHGAGLNNDEDIVKPSAASKGFNLHTHNVCIRRCY